MNQVPWYTCGGQEHHSDLLLWGTVVTDWSQLLCSERTPVFRLRPCSPQATPSQCLSSDGLLTGPSCETEDSSRGDLGSRTPHRPDYKLSHMGLQCETLLPTPLSALLLSFPGVRSASGSGGQPHLLQPPACPFPPHRHCPSQSLMSNLSWCLLLRKPKSTCTVIFKPAF